MHEHPPQPPRSDGASSLTSPSPVFWEEVAQSSAAGGGRVLFTSSLRLFRSSSLLFPHAPLVIKAGGTTIEDTATAPHLSTHSPASPPTRRPRLRPRQEQAVDRHLDRLGFTTERREGIRITPADQLDEITAVLAGGSAAHRRPTPSRADGRTVGLCLGDGAAIPTRKTTKYNFDPGQVGEVIASSSRSHPGAKPDLLPLLLSNHFLPVLCSIGIDADGRFLNINADDAAAGVAASMRAHPHYLPHRRPRRPRWQRQPSPPSRVTPSNA